MDKDAGGRGCPAVDKKSHKCDHTGLGRCWISMGVIAGCQSFLVVETIMGGFPKELSIDTFSPLSQEKQIISKLSPL